MTSRRCQRSGCQGAAISTLTYVYADSQAVLGPLAHRAEPGSYDLCGVHSHALSAPRGWDVIRLPMETAERPTHSSDDLLALADAVREVGLSYEPARPAEPEVPDNVVQLARKRHLSVLADKPL